MAKQSINIGSAANDGTGSTLRAAFDICNDNFTELYDGSGGLLHKIEGTNFTGSLLVGHSTTGTLSSAEYNTALGIGALDALTTGIANVAIGYNSGTDITEGSRNTLVGRLSGANLTTGVNNTAIGTEAMNDEDTGTSNVAVGYQVLKELNYDGAGHNVAVGYQAGKNATTSRHNSLFGSGAGEAITTGSRNVAIGFETLHTEDTGARSVAIGYQSLKNQNYGDNNYNTAVGYSSGQQITSGLQNTLIGSLAGDAITTGTNNIVIGYNAAASAVDVSNEITLGNSSIANVRIPADSTLKIGASGDLQLEHLSSNSFIKNTAVGDLYIENQVDSGDVIFRSDDGSGGLATYFYLNGGDTNINFQKDTLHPDNVKAKFGTSADLTLTHNGSNTLITNNTGNILFTQNADDGDILFYCDDGSGGVTEYFRLDGGNGNIITSVNNVFADGKKVCVGSSADLQIYHDGTNSQIRNEVGSFDIEQHTNDGNIRFYNDDGAGGTALYYYLAGAEATHSGSATTALYTIWQDNSIIALGAGKDMRLYHDGSSSHIENHTSNLTITNYADDSDIIFKSDDGSGGTTEYFKLDGSSASGGTVYTNWADNSRITLGAGNDMQLYHDGSNNYVDITLGDLYFTNYADDKDIIFKSDDGSGGVANYIVIAGAETLTSFQKNTRHNDSVIANFGTSSDLQIQHNGTDSQVTNTNGHLQFTNVADDKDITFASDNGSGGDTVYLTLDGGDVSTILHTVKVLMPNLPTSDPSVAGQLYTDSGVLKVSAG